MRNTAREGQPESWEPVLVGLRDRALIGVIVYTFARINAAPRDDGARLFYPGPPRMGAPARERGQRHEVPCHHNLEKFLDEYIAVAGIGADLDGPLFRTAAGKTGALTHNAMWQQDAYRLIQRRAETTSIKTRISNHTFRATGITAYLQNKGTLETAQQLANHESPMTTKLYDRRQDQISLDEVEKISI